MIKATTIVTIINTMVNPPKKITKFLQIVKNSFNRTTCFLEILQPKSSPLLSVVCRHSVCWDSVESRESLPKIFHFRAKVGACQSN
jgi:hypothetical protein